VAKKASTPKEAVTEQPKAVTSMQTESTTVSPETATLEAKSAKNFTAYLQPEATFSEEAALDVLRQKLRSYKEIHPDFLAMTEGENAFVLKKEYLPVYRQSAVVDYVWTVVNKGVKTAHSERREVSCRQHTAPALFCADSYPADVATIALTAPKKEEELYVCKRKTFSACVSALKKEAKAYAPHASAKIKVYNRSYEIFYVPVLKATCSFEGKDYVAYVNMLNGECDAQYRVSDALLEKVNKTMAKVKWNRRSVLFGLFYALTFAALGWYYAYQMQTLAQSYALLVGMASALIIPVLSYFFSFSYKRNQLIKKWIVAGKVSKAPLLSVLTVVVSLLALAEMLVYAIYILKF
jgi:hypothetical protein